MASLFEPVGPLDRRVYWRRRLVILGVLLVVLLIVLKACSGGDGGGTPASSASPAASPTTSSSPSPSSSSTAKSSPSASATKTTKPVTNCKDSNVVVTAKPAKSSYAVGDTVSITYVVKTKAGVDPCKRDVGGAADEVRVLSGSTVIWSSDYCSPGGKKDVRTIGPDDAFSVVVDWDGNVTSSGCPTDRLPAPAGVYQVVGRNGAVYGTSAKLTLG